MQTSRVNQLSAIKIKQISMHETDFRIILNYTLE